MLNELKGGYQMKGIGVSDNRTLRVVSSYRRGGGETMKKVALVCALLFVVAASASAAPYIWKLNGTDSTGGNYGGLVNVGVKTVSTTPVDQTYDTANAAYVASVVYTGALDTTMVKTNLYASNYTNNTDPKKWILEAWCGNSWNTSTQGANFDLRIWASTSSSTKPSTGWKLYKLYDPISNAWGHTDLGAVPVATSAGTQDSPWFTTSLPVYKTSTPTEYGKGYILELSIPEPGSMVAMLSGLVGLVGFGIRRRR